MARRKSSVEVVVVGAEVYDPQDGYRKERGLINIVPTNREITFVQKKIFNTVIFTVQEGQKLGYATIADPSGQTTYSIPFHHLREAIGFDGSRNYEYIVQNMDALTTIRVTHDWRGKKGRHHAAAPLISYVHVNEETGMVEFRLDASVENMVRSPEIYQRLNIRMQNVFSTAWQLTLFEIALQALASPAKRTATLGWEEWSCLLSGKPQPLSAFSSFNRTLKTTMTQVNKLQSQVEVDVHYEMQGAEPGKRGKKAVQALYFTVKLPQQAMFSMIEESAGSLQALIKDMASIGVSKEDAEGYLSAYGADYISAQLAYVKSQRNVRNKLAYFISSMKENYATYVGMGSVVEHRKKIAKAVSTAPSRVMLEDSRGNTSRLPNEEADMATPAKEKAGAGLAAALEKGRKLWGSEQRMKALERYEELSEEDQATIWRTFEEWARENKNKFIRDAIQKGGRSSKIAMTEFGEFLVYGSPEFQPPSDQEILDFMFKGGHLSV